MRAFRLLPVIALLALACQRSEADPTELSRQAFQTLAGRDRRLHSFQLEGTVTAEGAASLRYRFSFRAPNRMQVEVLEPSAQRLSFDGSRLFQHAPAEQRFEERTLSGGPAENTLALAHLFSPFVPEGYRAPRVQRPAVQVRRTKHPRGPEAITLTQVARSEGQTATVTFVHRWPSMDFLEKRTQLEGEEGEAALVVTDERCESALALCVPARLELRRRAAPTTVTTLQHIALNPALAADAFTLHPAPVAEGR